jgi:hypothetical protein
LTLILTLRRTSRTNGVPWKSGASAPRKACPQHRFPLSKTAKGGADGFFSVRETRKAKVGQPFGARRGLLLLRADVY